MAPVAAPMQVGASIDVAELNAKLAAMTGRVTNLMPVFTQIDGDLSKLLRAQFATEGQTFGTPWQKPSDATLAVRAAYGLTSRKAGRATGALLRSFASPNGPGTVRMIDALSYLRGSDLAVDGAPIAALMQRGFLSTHMPVFNAAGQPLFVRRPNGPKRVPARPILPDALPAPVMRAWEGYVAEYLDTGAVTPAIAGTVPGV